MSDYDIRSLKDKLNDTFEAELLFQNYSSLSSSEQEILHEIILDLTDRDTFVCELTNKYLLSQDLKNPFIKKYLGRLLIYNPELLFRDIDLFHRNAKELIPIVLLEQYNSNSNIKRQIILFFENHKKINQKNNYKDILNLMIKKKDNNLILIILKMIPEFDSTKIFKNILQNSILSINQYYTNDIKIGDIIKNISFLVQINPNKYNEILNLLLNHIKKNKENKIGQGYNTDKFYKHIAVEILNSKIKLNILDNDNISVIKYFFEEFEKERGFYNKSETLSLISLDILAFTISNNQNYKGINHILDFAITKIFSEKYLSTPQGRTEITNILKAISLSIRNSDTKVIENLLMKHDLKDFKLNGFTFIEISKNPNIISNLCF